MPRAAGKKTKQRFGGANLCKKTKGLRNRKASRPQTGPAGRKNPPGRRFYSLNRRWASASETCSQANGKIIMMAAKKTNAAAISPSFMASSPVSYPGPPGPDSLVP